MHGACGRCGAGGITRPPSTIQSPAPLPLRDGSILYYWCMCERKHSFIVFGYLGLKETCIDTIAELYFVLYEDLDAHWSGEDDVIVGTVSHLDKHREARTSSEGT